ncbi:hypothetical protein KP509_1Z147400 [Ceratopteris richardii]|nr:hypothetical protein KP509_1Z147400 [Ceratopteris richardii]
MAPPLHEAFDKHCVAYERVKEKSNVCRWHCKYCGRIQTSSVTRLLIHLCKLGGECAPCSKIPDNIYEECRCKYLPLKRRKGSFAENEVVSPDCVDSERGNCPSISIGSASVAPTMSSCGHDEVDVSKKAKGMGTSTSSRQPTLAQASGGVSDTITFLRERQRLAEIEIARTVIKCNLSFNVLRLDRWKCMVKAIANVGPCEGWYGVPYNDMRTKKLDEEKERIDKSLEPVRAGWVKYGCSILSDGWSDPKKRGIINILVSCPLGTYFLRAVDAGVKGKKVGPQNVIQVVTDNASNCASMGRKLEEEFPSIVWSPCASHCLDLLMEDIVKLEWIKSIISEATSIVDFINSKVRVLAIFRSYSEKELRKPSKTRFAAMWILLDRLYEVQNKLQKTVVSEEFKEWMDGEPIAQQQEAKSIQRLCLRESFWKNVYGIIVAILPLYKVLRMTDMEGATIDVLYHFMKEAIEEIKKCTTLDEPCDLSW